MTEKVGWKDETLVSTYLEGIKDGMPNRGAQFDIMLHLIECSSGSEGREVKSVLDIGAGDGSLAQAVLEKYPLAKAVLADFSAPMLKAARGKFAGTGCSIEIVEADFSTPAWIDTIKDFAPFDVIVSGYAIHHLSDERKKSLYKELPCLLSSGGIFINTDRVSSLSEWAGCAAGGYLIKTLRSYHEAEGTPDSFARIEARLKERDSEKSDILAPVEVQCGWLRDAGFVDVDCYFKAFEHAMFAGRRA